MKKVILKPAAVVLYLPDGQEAKALHFEPGDALSLQAPFPGLEIGKPYPILSYTHTADGTHVCLPGGMPKAYRVANEMPEGESREYFLKKLPATVTEICLPQVVNEVRFHPVKFQTVPVMRVSWTNPDLPIIHGNLPAAA